MSRPEFPRCVLPSNCISRVREEQSYYDQDPERAEREQADRAEQVVLEEEMERQQYEQMLEAQAREKEAAEACFLCLGRKAFRVGERHIAACPLCNEGGDLNAPSPPDLCEDCYDKTK